MSGLRVEAALVMTVLNESRSLKTFLRALESQTRLPAEVVIVDGGSHDGTLEILRAWRPPQGVRLELVVAPGAGISEGRNIAIRTASHELILVTDGGTVLAPSWVEALNAGLQGGADVACGFFEPCGETFFQRVLARAITPLISEVAPDKFLPSSRSVGFTKSAWTRAGGYPEWLDYCEDLVFDLQLKRTGARFEFAPGAIVAWSARPSIAKFMVQYYRYARGDGKAALWGRRHAARYCAYSIGALLLVGTGANPWVVAALGAGWCVYLSKAIRRVVNGGFGSGIVPAIALVPLVVTAGDIAKMAGWPAGASWRRHHVSLRDRAGSREGLS